MYVDLPIDKNATTQDFHRRRMKRRGYRFLHKALLFACAGAALLLAERSGLVAMWVAVIGAQILTAIACLYFGRFIENTMQLHRREKEYVPETMPGLRRLP